MGNNNNTKRPRSNNGKRSKFARKDDQSFENAKLRKEKFNDPNWYVANQQVLKDVASLSFNNALGGQSNVGFNEYDGDVECSDYSFIAPGIMTIMTAPAMGISDGAASPLSVAAKNFYSWIRHWNSGHVNYNSPDLMLYFGAMDSIYSIIACLTRAYGIARVFSQTNRYIGDALLSRMGFDPNEVRANLADMRGFINMYITKVSAFCVPNTMTLYKRHFWMYSGVYKDENVVKSQMYMYVPAVFWKYNEMEGAGKLDAVYAFAGADPTNDYLLFQQKSLAEIYNLANTLLGAIVNSEDINIMSGDVLKAYGKENLWNLALVPEDYAVFPEYSEEVLDQIHNSSFAGTRPVSTLSLDVNPQVDLTRLGIIQDPEIGDGALYFRPQFKNAIQLGYDVLVDMHKEEPTPEDVIVATRNILTGKSSLVTASGAPAGTAVTTLQSCGSDICLYAIISTMNPNGSISSTGVYNMNGGIIANNIQTLSKLTQFNKFPHFKLLAATGNITGMIGELDNYTVISHDDINRMHESAVLSQLGVPFLGEGYRH